MSKITGIAAAALLTTTLAAAALSQTDSRGSEMGLQKVGNGQPSTMALGTTTERSGTGINHPTPSSAQGDVGPGGSNNGTRTGLAAHRSSAASAERASTQPRPISCLL